jgi:hypothetical protein
MSYHVAGIRIMWQNNRLLYSFFDLITKKKGRKMEKIGLMALEPKLVATSLKMHLNNNIWEKEKGAG